MGSGARIAPFAQCISVLPLRRDARVELWEGVYFSSQTRSGDEVRQAALFVVMLGAQELHLRPSPKYKIEARRSGESLEISVSR